MLNKHLITIEENDTYTLTASVYPPATSVTWSSASESVATVSDGVVTAEGTGNTIVTASITTGGVTYNDTCTVVVTAAAE